MSGFPGTQDNIYVQLSKIIPNCFHVPPPPAGFWNFLQPETYLITRKVNIFPIYSLCSPLYEISVYIHFVVFLYLCVFPSFWFVVIFNDPGYHLKNQVPRWRTNFLGVYWLFNLLYVFCFFYEYKFLVLILPSRWVSLHQSY